MRVLLVEDDKDLAEVVILGLQQEHLAVDHAAGIEDARRLLLTTKYDVVCLDLGLPDGDGLEFCNEIYADGGPLRPHRLLILTARNAVADRVAGLDAGADDYLVKPFSIAELSARIRALVRRVDQTPGPVEIGDLTVDVVGHRAERDGRALGLTAREFAVLRYFCHHIGEVVSSEDLLDHCWDEHGDAFGGSERVILSRLRKKLGDPPLIQTIKGAGYRIDRPQ